jgi:hypothetical protein
MARWVYKAAETVAVVALVGIYAAIHSVVCGLRGRPRRQK